MGKSRYEQLELILFLICAAIIGLTGSSVPLNIFFAFIFSINFLQYIRKKNFYYLFKILIYSIVVPNNYFIIFLIPLGFITKKLIDKTNEVKKISWIVFLSIIYLIFNILVNEVNLINLIFGIIYMINIYVAYFFMKNSKEELNSCYEKNKEFLKQILLVELFTICLFFVSHLSITSDFNSANDWVTGTFGKEQGNIFLYFCLFCFLFFQYNYKKSKNKKDIIYIIISVFCAIMTNSIALIILFSVSYMLFNLIYQTVQNKIKILIYFSIAFCIFCLVTPGWTKKYIMNLTDYNYFKNNILKVVTYEDTFSVIPSKDKKFLFFGNGIGEYSSRAALTCSGYYVDSYRKFFAPSISNYSNNFIIKRYVYWNLEHGYGTMYSPFSSIITLQGEYGIIGLTIFLVSIIILIKKGTMESKTFLLFFLFSCFIENYIEFAKVDLLIFMLYFICYERKNDNET